jgi:Flp pilus assembly pilin Flp
MLTRSGVDTGDPQGTEYALLVTAIAVRILTCAHHRLLGDAIYGAATAAVTLGLL